MEKDRLRIGIIFGGRSGEHEVSLMSARSVLSAIDTTKYQVIQIGIAPDGSWWIGENVLEAFLQKSYSQLTQATILPDPSRPGLFQNVSIPGSKSLQLELLVELDAVFPVLHGTFGEDGTVQGLLELADVAYVGAGVMSSAVGMDKAVFKDLMRANGVPVVESVTVFSSELEQDGEEALRRAESLAGYPLFVKPANLGSSVGITKCRTRSDLVEGMQEACRFDRKILIERGLVAREIEISVIGNEDAQVSLPGEVIPSREFYSYEAKYIDHQSALIIPAPLPEKITERVQDLALRAYKAIDCAGMARVDFLLEKQPTSASELDGLYLGEINTIPGFTEISMYPKLWEASGLPYPALIDRLIELAQQRKSQRDRIERHYDW